MTWALSTALLVPGMLVDHFVGLAVCACPSGLSKALHLSDVRLDIDDEY